MTDQKTQIVQADIGTDEAYGAVSPPLYLSSTYKFQGFEQEGPFDYGRGGNPNRDALGAAIAKLEGGAGATITSSGMAAIDLLFNLFKADDLIIAPHDCYGGTHRLLIHQQIQGRLRAEFVDQNDGKALSAALAKQPKLILIETPSNPLMRLVDIQAITEAAHKAGALVAVDNTFLSPARQTPMALGADFVIHSTTKYLNGHSDVVGGALVAKTQDHAAQIAWWANCTGVTGSPFDSFQTLRGMRTLFARMDAGESNAIAIAKFLKKQKNVSHVYFPGLKSDPGYKLMKRQQSGPGAMISFELAGGRDAAKTMLENITLFQMAESLGGVESLICHPASMTHRAMDADARQIAGIRDNLLRLSVGIEAERDLIGALKEILSAM